MISERYNELINKLIEGTKQKKLKWEKTQRDTEFKVVLGSSWVTTDNWILNSGVYCVDLGIWNSKGEQAGRIAFEDDGEEQKDYNALLELYSAVKSAYYNVDDTFDEIFSHLNFNK